MTIKILYKMETWTKKILVGLYQIKMIEKMCDIDKIKMREKMKKDQKIRKLKKNQDDIIKQVQNTGDMSLLTKQNLNRMLMRERSFLGGHEQENNGMITSEIECYFKDIEKTIIKKILEADVVVGCIAWLTNNNILQALQKVEGGVNIIVQKELFIRSVAGTKYYNQYSNIKPLEIGTDAQVITNTIVDSMNMRDKTNDNAVRCTGLINVHKKMAFPRMHNKFIVFCKLVQIDKINKIIKPYGVWTGSFNLTDTATLSFENNIYLKTPEICAAYLKEWAQIYALSEHVNWKSKDCSPDLHVV